MIQILQQKIYISKSEEETYALGEQFAKTLKNKDIVALFGDLGAGKSVFARGVAQGLGINSPMPSPTFNIVNIYLSALSFNFNHFDVYRLSHIDELEHIGFYEIIENGISVIEWAEKIYSVLPVHTIDVKINYSDELREIVINER